MGQRWRSDHEPPRRSSRGGVVLDPPLRRGLCHMRVTLCESANCYWPAEIAVGSETERRAMPDSEQVA